jgi:predicted Rossmann fold nucleotide-binding protein DprA/Smf involved in DNA uptake
MTIAIVGSRKFPDLDMVRNFVKALPEVAIISGHATGVDRCAEEAALQRGLQVVTLPAKWDDITVDGAVIRINKWGKQYNAAAGHQRNKLIVYNALLVVAFWDGSSPGTLNTMQQAQKMDKPVHALLPCSDWQPVIDFIKNL